MAQRFVWLRTTNVSLTTLNAQCICWMAELWRIDSLPE